MSEYVLKSDAFKKVHPARTKQNKSLVTADHMI